MLVVLAALVPAADAAPGWARIVRTDYGVAHIVADDWTDVGFGEGYAFAADDACVFADDVVTLRGERSRWFGPAGRVRDLADGLDTDNLTSDFFYRRIDGSGVVERLLAGTDPSGSPAPSARSRQLVAGYAAGYDAYLAAVGGSAGIADPACRGAPWVGPIDALDVWHRLYQLALLTTSVGYLPDLVGAAPPGRASPAAAGPDTTATTALTRPATDPVGSNAWAFGARASTGGRGVLLGNPHFPWSGPERFWEVQLTVPGELDVEGATLAGVPGVLIGFNRHVAWSFTVSAADAAAVYQLDLVPGQPTRYRVDGVPEAMTSQTVTVDVRGPDGRIGRRSRTFWASRYGPVLVSGPAGLGWTTTTAYSLLDPDAANLRLLDTVLDIDTADGTGAVAGALHAHEGLPWVNTVAADDAGHALFADVSVVPHVTDVQQAACATAVGLGGGVPLPVLDGSHASCLPGRDPDSAAAGIFGGTELPGLVRTDYVANSNDGPWLTNPAQPLTGYPLITADNRRPPSLRTRLGLRMIGQRLAGSDGLPGTGFDLGSVEKVALNDRNYAAELVLPDLVRRCRGQPSARASNGTVVDLSAGCTALAGWDGRDGLNDRGAVLFHEFMAGAYGPRFFADRYDPAAPLTTPARLSTADPGLLTALADAVQRLTAAGVPLDAAWGGVRYVRRGGQRVPIHGSDDPGVFNVVDSTLDPAAHGYPGVASGVSFLLAVEFTAGGPRADAILAYGQTDDPDAPHAADQTLLYSRGAWARLPFTDTEVRAAARLARTVHP